MEYSIPQIITIVFLLFLFYFIASCLGYMLFRKVKSGTQMTPDIVNFSNFYRSIITLFRSSTGEDWQAILADLMAPGCEPNCSLYGNFSFLFFKNYRRRGFGRVLYFVRHSHDLCDAEPVHAGAGPVV
jgi:hypothetical protein